MNERQVIDGVIAYLKNRKENIDYFVERVAEDEELLEEIDDLGEMIESLKKIRVAFEKVTV